ncbi:MAG TPA: dihydrolipoamide acetyltransferase family protein [Candidatus Limnocylindrales bacterium]|nr:dihydrolipoamide acetyltransferase family protein [Candidatus Limnocylindrales bacterium]
MAHPILMPKPGQMTEECVLTAWHKEVGDAVHRGDVLFEIETDKSAMEVETFEDGVLLAKLAQAGDTVPVNSVCGWIGEAGEAVPQTPVVAAAPVVPVPSVPVPATAIAAAPEPVAAAEPAPTSVAAAAPAAPTAREGRLRISPRASRLAADAGIDPRTLAGTGPEGRIVERDIATAVAARAVAPVAAPAPAGGPAPAAAAPVVHAPVAPVAPVAPMAVAPVEGEEEPRQLSRMRRTIAARLTNSWQTTPHFTVTVAVDVTRVMALRAELKAEGHSLTVTDFVLAATAQTLAEFLDVNSRTDGDKVYPRRRVHLGVAVSVPAGLVVPVVRDADRMTILELHDRVANLAGAAREGTIAVDDLTGSTFTVSNLGMFGVEEFSAIINPGEAAILAVSSAVATPLVIDGGIGIRQVMKLTLSADHRIVDGEMGARFLNALRRRLEDVRAFRDEVANA